MPFEPADKLRNASSCQRDAGIGGAVEQVDAVAVGIQRVPAGERHVTDVAFGYAWPRPASFMVTTNPSAAGSRSLKASVKCVVNVPMPHWRGK